MSGYVNPVIEDVLRDGYILKLKVSLSTPSPITPKYISCQIISRSGGIVVRINGATATHAVNEALRIMEAGIPKNPFIDGVVDERIGNIQFEPSSVDNLLHNNGHVQSSASGGHIRIDVLKYTPGNAGQVDYFENAAEVVSPTFVEAYRHIIQKLDAIAPKKA